MLGMETLRATKVREDSVSASYADTSYAVSNADALFLSRYKLVRPLKKGGTSDLYLVKDKLCQSLPTVIKLICKDVTLPQLDNRLAVSEFLVASRLSHPNIVNIYNVHRDELSEYLVMEYLEGSSLNDLLSRGILDYKQVVSLVEPIVNALDYLHDNGVVHCDIKPSNIFVTRNGPTKLIDLANCRQDSNKKSPAIRIKENSFFGFSHRYSSPQIVGDKPATTSDDVYSLAIVIYEMLMGSLPTAMAKTGRLSLSSMKKPKTINFRQWAILKRAMSPDQRKRYTSVKSFFDQFCRARYIAYVVSGSVVSGMFLLLVVAYFTYQWGEHHARYLQYQAAQQQLDTIAQVTDRIRRVAPEQRYLQLEAVNGLDEFSRRVVLNEVYEDVVLQAASRVSVLMLGQAGANETSQLLEELKTLSFYYPRAQEISDSVAAIQSEVALRLQGVLIAANDLLDSEVFDRSLANKINDLASLNQGQWPHVAPKTDLAAYSLAVESALSTENWPVAIALFQFGDSVSHSLPQVMQGWSKNADIVKHVKNFSDYFSSGQNTIGYFPEESADFFFAERLNAVNKSLGEVWFNKDIKRYSSELLEIRSEYNIPEDYERFQQAYNLLLEKIDSKIRHHQRSGQRQSMQDLVNLKNSLS